MGETAPGFLQAVLLDGKGGGREIPGEQVADCKPEDGFLWIHLDFTCDGVLEWLMEGAGLEQISAEALVSDETRPRSVASHDALLMILRGVNLNPGEDPEDMVSVRAWVESGRAITLRRRRLMAVQDLRRNIAGGTGPCDTGEFVVDLAGLLTGRVAGVLEDIDDAVDALEDEVLSAESHELRPRIGRIRRQVIGLRRYLSPQREVMARLQMEKISWFDDLERQHLREIADRVTRYVEDLDSARDRAAVSQEELNARLADQMNRTMYLLSIVAAVFLPLGLITGLLGINVGGIPGTESPLAFAIVCLLLVVLAGFEIMLFHRKKWL